MKIVILNHCYLTDSHREKLKKLGEVVEYQSTTNEQDAIERLKGADVAVVDMYEFPINAAFFAQTKELRYICLNSTGFNLVDLKAAQEKGITVFNLPGFSTKAVAEHAIALMFTTMRNIVLGNTAMHAKPFQLNPANRAEDIYISTNIYNKTIGIIGLGKIGTRVAEMAKGLGMKVIVYNRSPKNISGVQMCSLDELYKNSDIIAITSAFAPDLKNLIDEKAIEQMKPSVFIVNIARGEFIDEEAMAKALKEKKVAGLGADVLADWSDKNPLLNLVNVVLTPHMAFLADESTKNMADTIVANVESFVNGKPINIVNLL